jgi:PhzF family phenazine biosynthesis protein
VSRWGSSEGGAGVDDNDPMTPEVLRYSAFTENGRGGNPAGVVLAAAGLDPQTMLGIAAEVGYSETAFLVPDEPGRATIRYFSPQAEVAFCGHATIATAVALAERTGPGPLALQTAAGPVTVRTASTPAGLTATLTSPPARSAPADPGVVEQLLTTLRWDRADLDPRYPVHVAHAGNDHPVLAAGSLDRLARFDYDYDALAALMAEQGWTTVHAFWAESDDLFPARNAFPPGGVVEDPATGAAAAAFGGYLRTLAGSNGSSGWSGPRPVTVLQGHHMGRPSRLVVDIPGAPDTGIDVTGTAGPVETAPGPVTDPGPDPATAPPLHG